MPELASNIPWLLLLRDGNELHRRDQLFSLEKSCPQNHFQRVDHQAVLLDAGWEEGGGKEWKWRSLGRYGGGTEIWGDREDIAWGEIEYRT